MLKEKQKHKSQEKGITLIALVITIIVLLILAGVALNALVGDSGILSNAEQAKEATRAKNIQEQIDLWKSELEIAKHTGGTVKTQSEILTDLVQQGLLTENEKASIEHSGRVTIGDQTITLGETTKTLVEMFNDGEIEIGDYIEYQIPTKAEYTSTGDKTGMAAYQATGNNVTEEQLNQKFTTENKTIRWRVIGIDEATGGLKLIAADSIGKESSSGDTKFYLYGARGYINGVTELNNICSIYKNDLALQARSATANDINLLTGATSDLLGTINAAPSPDSYGKTYTMENAYTPEMKINQEEPTTFTVTNNAYMYFGMNENLKTYSDANLRNIINGIDSDYTFYWIDNQNIYASSNDNPTVYGIRYVMPSPTGNFIMCISLAMYSSTGNEAREGYLVRPVVILHPYITEEDLNVRKAVVEPENITDWDYTVDSTTNTITITRYRGTDTEVTIPNYINGIPVKKIGTNADGKERASLWHMTICQQDADGFRAYKYYQNTITKIVVPEGIEEIGEQAFLGTRALETIELPETLKTIGTSTFEGCVSLKEVIIPNKVTEIPDMAFAYCSALTNVIIPDNVTKIGTRAFSNCSSLKGIIIPNGVSIINQETFHRCLSLSYVQLPNTIKTIGNHAFYGCSGLTSVTIPDSVTNIGNSTFKNCSGLTNLVIPSSVTSIGSSAFEFCSGLTSLTISSSVKTIEDFAFSNCTGLTSVTIPSSVKTIGYMAFSSCKGLTNVTIPSSVTTIGYKAFAKCIGLKSVYFEQTEAPTFGNRCFYNTSGYTTYYFKNSTVYDAFTTSHYTPAYRRKIR